jgi:F-type H+-transporting ATPase subunit delta
MINNKLVRNYTAALFANALNNALEDRIFEQITVITKIITDNSKIKTMMFSPIVKEANKLKIIEVIEKILDIESIVKNFLVILLKHSRAAILPEIVLLYQQLLNNSKNTKMVKITSAKILRAEERKWIEQYLEDDLQQKITVEYSENQLIIGGIIIQYDSVVRDCSIVGALEKIRKTLKTVKIDWN